MLSTLVLYPLPTRSLSFEMVSQLKIGISISTNLPNTFQIKIHLLGGGRKENKNTPERQDSSIEMRFNKWIPALVYTARSATNKEAVDPSV